MISVQRSGKPEKKCCEITKKNCKKEMYFAEFKTFMNQNVQL